MAELSLDGPKMDAFMAYNTSERVIKICRNYDYADFEIKAMEERCEAILSHEIIHAVLHKIMTIPVSTMYDNLGETPYYTPYSFPRGCEQQ